LDELSQRVRAAQEAAERILEQASSRPRGGDGAAGDRAAPPGGYEAPAADPRDARSAEAQALAALLDLGRGFMPPELRQALAELVRELLLLVRALIDWYLDRAAERREAPVEVRDIPIS
jgi:hypothetical protein